MVQSDMTKLEQRWRPIALMPAFKFAISRAAETSHAQAENMRLAIASPGSVNRFELARLRLIYEETARNVDMCREQLRRWRGESTVPEQLAALDHLDAVVEQWADDTHVVIRALKVLSQEK
jgi:hypothetical protein